MNSISQKRATMLRKFFQVRDVTTKFYEMRNEGPTTSHDLHISFRSGSQLTLLCSDDFAYRHN